MSAAILDQATPDQADPGQAIPDQASPDQTSPDQASDDAEHFRRALRHLVDRGAAIADQLADPRSDLPATDRAEAFERVARAVRRTILLAEHLAQGRKISAQRRTAARKRVYRAIDDIIARDRPRPTDAEPLRAELLERLDSPDFDDDIAAMPPDEVVDAIKRDLGLATPAGMRLFPRRTPADIAAICAVAAAPPGHARAAAGPLLTPAPHPEPDDDPDDDRDDDPGPADHSLLAALLRRTPAD